MRLKKLIVGNINFSNRFPTVKAKDTDSVICAEEAGSQAVHTTAQSVIWDRGMELARHKEFTIATDMRVYFCDPRSPWQWGSNENTNGLLRQYFLKGASLASYSQSDLNKNRFAMNQRLRKTLSFTTPTDKLSASIGVAFTG
jgi:IS30 family transposase